MGEVRDVAREMGEPVVVVYSSDDAEVLCAYNNLSPTDLLRPFSKLRKINIRDTQGNPYMVDHFSLKIVQPQFLEKQALPWVSVSSPQATNIATQATPWFTQYRDDFIQNFGVSEHEYFQHPVACIMMISSSNPDPINTLLKLFHSQQPPPIFNKGFMDPNVLKYYVLLHDATRGKLEDAEATFQKMKTTFGIQSKLLVINSLKYPNLEQNLWNYLNVIMPEVEEDKEKEKKDQFDEGNHPLERPSSINHNLHGQFLSGKDVDELSAFVREFATQLVIPFMERNVANWNETIAASRRGLTGKLFSVSKKYFGAQSKQPLPTTSISSTSSYHYTSPEAQLRKLADYSFMLQDYKLALSVYDTVRKDFSTDKAFKHLAGAHEMMGICQAILNENWKEMDSNFEIAVSTYNTKCKLPHYGTRATFIYYEYLKSKGYYREAIPSLLRTLSEDLDLQNALVMEQVAHSFLKVRPPLQRKYAFHLVLAGVGYMRCRQKAHAYRCYSKVVESYSRRDWSFINEHIQLALAKQAFQLNFLEKSVEHFINVFRDVQQQPQQQTEYLREFSQIYKHVVSQREGFSIDFGIPKIEDETVRVIQEHQRNLTDTHLEEAWTALEQAQYSSSRDATRQKKKKFDDRPICFVREPLYVLVEFSNPLQVPIQLRNIALQFAFNPHELITTKDPLTNEDQFSIKEKESKNENISDIVQTEVVEVLQMDSLEKIQYEFKLTPKREGTLKILGLTYVLNGTINCDKLFTQKSNPGDITEKKKGLNQSLNLIITSPMPQLEVQFEGFPNQIFSGEVQRANLVITNKGEKTLSNLKVKLSHPSFFYFGKMEHLNIDVYEETTEGQAPIFTPFDSSNVLKDPSLVDICLINKNEDCLLSGESVTIPVWIRGDRVGIFNFQFLFIYGSDFKNPVMKTRKLRFEQSLNVASSIRISAVTRPSVKELNQCILSVELENLLPNAIFHLKQVSATSLSWEVGALSFEPTEDSSINKNEERNFAVIGPKEIVSFYFKLSRNSNFVFDQELAPETSTSKAIEQYLKGENITSKPRDASLIYTDLPCMKNGQKNCRTIKSYSPPLSGLLHQSYSSSRFSKLQTTYPEIPDKILTSLFSLYTTNDINLTLFWSCQPGNRIENPKAPLKQNHGHHYFLGIHLGTHEPPLSISQPKKTMSNVWNNLSSPQNKEEHLGRSLFASTEKEKLSIIHSLSKIHSTSGKPESPLKHVLIAPDIVYFDFTKESFCEIEVKMLIQNCSTNKNIEFLVEFLPPLESLLNQSQQLQSPGSNSSFSWVGKTKQLLSLGPEEKTEATCFAAISYPGIFELSKIRVKINHPKEITHLSPNIQHLVSVRQICSK